MEIGSHRLALGCRSINIIDLKVGQPVRRRSRLPMGPGWNASDEGLAVLNMQVAGRIFRVRDQLPSEKAGVKIRRSFRVGGTQVGPSERGTGLGGSDARGFFRRPGTVRP